MNSLASGIAKNVWLTWLIGHMMDGNGGIVNFQCLQKIRGLETKGRKYVRTLLPSSSSIKQLLVQVNKIEQIVTPYQLTSLDGESIAFNYQKSLKHIPKSFSLNCISFERRVHVASSIDGARLTVHTNIIMTGLKIQDSGSMCAQTNTPLLSATNKNHQL